jgi:hypothetical protein
MREEVREDGIYYQQFDSIVDLVDTVKSRPATFKAEVQKAGGGLTMQWSGVDSFPAAYKLALDGWEEHTPEILDVASDAVEAVFRTAELPTFVAEHGVSGCEVDVARYLDGTPENMIDYPLRQVVRAGRVITLCASVDGNGGFEARAFVQRGAAVTALAIALSQLGYATEFWVDWTTKMGGRTVAQQRVLIKAPQDSVDVGAMMYAFAHPSVLRIFGFTEILAIPDYKSRIGWGYGGAADPIEDLPEGTIYLPALVDSSSVPNAPEQVKSWLTDLGIITD